MKTKFMAGMCAALICASIVGHAQNGPAPGGVSVSPSTIRMNVKPGASQQKTVKVTNDSKRKIMFRLSFQDVGLDAAGIHEVAVPGSNRYALSRFLMLNPSYLELNPGESSTVQVIANIPDADSTHLAMWTTLVIDEIRERGKMEVPDAGAKTIGLGIQAGIGFGVNIYQNPPEVKVNDVEITGLQFSRADQKKKNGLVMSVKNNGDGIGYCLYYVELTNLLTGKISKHKVKQFGILPGYSRQIMFEIPTDLPKGKYSALTVLDFGDKEELRTAEVEFNL